MRNLLAAASRQRQDRQQQEHNWQRTSGTPLKNRACAGTPSPGVALPVLQRNQRAPLFGRRSTPWPAAPTFTRRDAILGGGGLVLGILGRSMDLAASTRAHGQRLHDQRHHPDDFSWWTEDSPTIAALTGASRPCATPTARTTSPSRIVVSGMDGTFLGELCPIYFDWAMFIHRALYDGTYTATGADRLRAPLRRSARAPSDDLWTEQAFYAAQVCAGADD